MIVEKAAPYKLTAQPLKPAETIARIEAVTFQLAVKRRYLVIKRSLAEKNSSTSWTTGESHAVYSFLTNEEASFDRIQTS
jgi:hypothetical protein